VALAPRLRADLPQPPARDSAPALRYPASAGNVKDPDMADEHKHGDMDVSTHEKTFEAFVRVAAYTAGGIVLLLLFIAAVNA